MPIAQLRIDYGACIRSGECYYNHPELVRMGASGDPQLIATDLLSEPLLQHAREAVEVCPARAIVLDENFPER